jgi:hypothetical protein
MPLVLAFKIKFMPLQLILSSCKAKNIYNKLYKTYLPVNLITSTRKFVLFYKLYHFIEVEIVCRASMKLSSLLKYEQIYSKNHRIDFWGLCYTVFTSVFFCIKD